MCQTGAIGRAERGAGYREILGWYYSGAAPVRIY
jgi:peptidoglycan hydrolase-like amidase